MDGSDVVGGGSVHARGGRLVSIILCTRSHVSASAESSLWFALEIATATHILRGYVSSFIREICAIIWAWSG